MTTDRGRAPDAAASGPDEPWDTWPCGLVVTDADGVVRHANHELARLVGRDLQDVVGRMTLASLLSAGGRAYLETHLLPVVAHDGVVREVSLDLVRPDGSRVPVLVNALAEPGDGPTGGAGLRLAVLETRQRHRYEQDLLVATRAAQQARAEATDLARALQQTLVPPAPPSVPGLSIAAEYRPAGDGSTVGGDFSDVFQLDATRWVAAVGDVSGKGVGAAVVTALVRHTIRALAVSHPDPADLLRSLDRQLRATGSTHYCTVALAHLTDAGTHWTARVALAGHPPPLLRSGDGGVVEVGVFGNPVGLVRHPTFTTVEVTLTDEVLVLFTDGVTEARSLELGLWGDARLQTLVARTAHDPAAVAAGIVSAVLDFQDADASDDIAVLALAPAARPGTTTHEGPRPAGRGPS